MNRPEQGPHDQGANNDDEAVWLDLVARLEQTSSDDLEPGNRPWDLDGESVVFDEFDPLGLAGAGPGRPEAGGTPDGPAGQFTAGSPDGDAVSDHAETGDEGDEGFVPEEPPSLADADPLTVLAWTGAVGGPVSLLLAAIFWRSAPLLAILGIIAAFIASVVFLVFRLPTDRDSDDDGAVL